MADGLLKWIFILDEEFSWQSGHGDSFGAGCAFEDVGGKRRLELRPGGTIHVLPGYAWDGCSPKFAFLDVAWGTPDGVPNHSTTKPKAYYASLVHDALYQFLDDDLPLSRAQADRIFYDILVKHDFYLAGFYYRAVRIFGGIAHAITRRKRGYAGKKITL